MNETKIPMCILFQYFFPIYTLWKFKRQSQYVYKYAVINILISLLLEFVFILGYIQFTNYIT